MSIQNLYNSNYLNNSGSYQSYAYAQAGMFGFQQQSTVFGNCLPQQAQQGRHPHHQRHQHPHHPQQQANNANQNMSSPLNSLLPMLLSLLGNNQNCQRPGYPQGYPQQYANQGGNQNSLLSGLASLFSGLGSTQQGYSPYQANYGNANNGFGGFGGFNPTQSYSPLQGNFGFANNGCGNTNNGFGSAFNGFGGTQGFQGDFSNSSFGLALLYGEFNSSQQNYPTFQGNYGNISNHHNACSNSYTENAWPPITQQNDYAESNQEATIPPMCSHHDAVGCRPTDIETNISDTSVWGDPHYQAKGSDGTTDINFTHNGTTGDTYNVFQGDGYEVDGKYGLAGNDVNKILDANIKDGNDLINYNVNGETSINGKKLNDGETITLADGTKISQKGTNMTMDTKDGNSSIGFRNNDGICLDPTGKFTNIGGILGTAIAQNKNLTEEEANKFDITNTKTAASDAKTTAADTKATAADTKAAKKKETTKKETTKKDTATTKA
ncbi:MAG: hypothetical protein WCG23_03015 [bacterium]